MTDYYDIPSMSVDRDEYRDSSGSNVQLCAVHELDVRIQIRKQAITTVCGWAVCREHMDALTAHIRSGATDPFILRALATGTF